MDRSIVMSILVDKRTEAALHVQEVLTQYGCSIHARFGLHEAGGASCEEEGLIVLYLCDKEKVILDLENALKAITGITVRHMDIR